MPNDNSIIVRENFFTSKRKKILWALPIIVSAAYGCYVIEQNIQSLYFPDQGETIEEVLARDASTPFTYTLVPQALEFINLPPPTYSDENLVYYTEMKKKYEESDLPSRAEDSILQEKNPQGDTIESLLTQGRDQGRFFIMSEELRQLADHFNKQYMVKPLFERYQGAVELVGSPVTTIAESVTPSVYPSERAVFAFLVADYMAERDTENASFYKDLADKYAEEGVVFGWYDKETITVSRDLVTQYLTSVTH